MHNSFSSHLHSPPAPKRAPHWPARQRHPRKRSGQALLLAVLLMVFVALLAATFVTVVALNLNQTARTEDKSRARQASIAGLNYVNSQLSNSPDGLAWFANQPAPPQPGNANFNSYYTPFDKAQGWAGKYIKFPDPLRPAAGDTPTYLVNVETIAATDGDNGNGEKLGDLRITVIGLSPDDPAAFNRVVNYKGGPRRNPFGGAMRVVSNNYLAGGQVPHSFMSAIDTTRTIVTVGNIAGKFPAAPFYAVIGGPNRTVSGRILPVYPVTVASYVTNPTDSTKLDLTLSTALPTTYTVTTDDRVEIAAGLGSQTKIDPQSDVPLPDGTTAPKQASPFDVSATKTIMVGTTSTPLKGAGSVWVNGAIYWFGNMLSHELRSGSPDYVRSSGLQALHTTTDGTTSTLDTMTVGGTYDSGTIANVTLVDSTTGNFPGDWKNGSTPLTAAQKDSLWSDGLNRLKGRNGATISARMTGEFTPPDILTTTDGVNRYLQQTKFSAPSDAAYPSDAGLYGYGQGIYLNNAEDRPKFYDATNTKHLVDMTQAQLVKMWVSPASTTGTDTFVRLPPTTAPVPVALAANVSLEEKHLRGWIGPDEFRPRGPVIELNIDTTKLPTDDANASFITITRDARSDTSPNGPDDSKAWQSTAGVRQSGVYTKSFTWPKNGIIFAEGDVRVKGGVSDPDITNADKGARRSLTIVSMGDIYVEGSLNAGGRSSRRKILLLARHNVICNPTATLQRVEAHTRVGTTAASASTSLTVADAANFKPGDLIVAGTDTGTATLPVAAIKTIATNTLTLDRPITALANVPVRTVGDRDDPNKATGLNLDSVPYDANFIKRASLDTTAKAIQRRVFVPVGAISRMRLALLHSAVRKTGLTVKLEQATGTGTAVDSARLASMLVDKPTLDTTINNVITKTQKKISIASKDAGVVNESEKLYPNLPPITGAETVTDVANQLTATGSAPSAHWGFTATPGASYTNLKFTALASYGNRKTDLDFGALPPNIPDNPATPGTTTTYGGWRFDFDAMNTPKTLELPLATSVDFVLNGAAVAMGSVDNQPNTSLVSAFGFAPTFADNQDVITSDSGFYPDLVKNASLTGTAGYTYDSRAMAVTPGGDNSMTLHLDNALTALTAADMPAYQLAHLKVENSDMFNSTTGAFQGVLPGDAIDVRAFVYAQQGSWFVIPGGFVDEDLKNHIRYYSGAAPGYPAVSGYYYDFNGDQHPYATGDSGFTKQTNEYAILTVGGVNTMVPDLNRDGVATPDEFAVISRFLRYNYAVSFTGAILENQTAMVLNDGTNVIGGVQEWTDKWTTVETDATGNVKKDLGGNVIGYTPMQYHYDNSLSTVDTTTGAAALNTNADPDAGLQIPVPANLLYQE